MFKYTLDNKRYHTLNYFLRNKFNNKVFKVPLDAGFGCPNIPGCIYCTERSKASIVNSKDNILKQFKENVRILEKKWPNSLYIPYFQAGSNTWTDKETLKNLLEPLLNINKVVGLSIATRPDCFDNDILDYLEELNKKTFLTIEIGLQSAKDETLKLINRGHDVECFDNAVKELKKRNIFVVAHIINGLPYETKEDMINTVKHLNILNIDAVKIHMLYINKGTPLETLYQKDKFHILTKEEYIDIVVSELEYLNESIVIERITGDPVKEELVAPTWLLKKFVVLNDIDKEMVRRNTYQGIK